MTYSTFKLISQSFSCFQGTEELPRLPIFMTLACQSTLILEEVPPLGCVTHTENVSDPSKGGIVLVESRQQSDFIG